MAQHLIPGNLEEENTSGMTALSWKPPTPPDIAAIEAKPGISWSVIERRRMIDWAYTGDQKRYLRAIVCRKLACANGEIVTIADETWNQFATTRLVDRCVPKYDPNSAKGGGFWPFLVISFRQFCRDKSQQKPPTVRDPDRNPVSDPRVAAEENELKLALEGAVAELPQTYRVPLQMHYYENKSNKEISILLDISPELARQRVHRGLVILRKKMEDWL